MQIGMRIYYDRNTGELLVNTGEMSGDVVEVPIERDFEKYKALSDRVPETVGMLALEYGEYREDFASCSGYRINPSTLEIEFSYKDPNETEQLQEPAYQPPLSERIEAVDTENAELALELALTQARINQAEQEQSALILSLVEGGAL